MMRSTQGGHGRLSTGKLLPEWSCARYLLVLATVVLLVVGLSGCGTDPSTGTKSSLKAIALDVPAKVTADDGGKAKITGKTAPKAVVRVGQGASDGTTTADAKGDFSLTQSLADSETTRDVTVTASLDGQEATKQLTIVRAPRATFTVAFDLKGGAAPADGTAKTVKVKRNATVKTPSNPVWPDGSHTFAGWTDCATGAAWDFAKPVAADIRVCASWKTTAVSAPAPAPAQSTRPASPTKPSTSGAGLACGGGTVYVASKGRSGAYWCSESAMPSTTKKRNVVSMTEQQALAAGKHHSLRE